MAKKAGLTIIEIQNAKPRDKRWKLNDGGGLYVLIRPSGVKSWCFDYQHDNKRKTATIGTFPEIGLKEARAIHQKMRMQRAEGLDPSRVKIQARQDNKMAQRQKAQIFADVARRFFELKRKAVNPTTARVIEQRYAKHIAPQIGSRPLLEIKPMDVITLIRGMQEQGLTDVSHRVKHIISQIFGFAIAEGVTDYDPTQNIALALQPAKKATPRRALPISSLGQFLRDLDTYEAPATRNAVKLIIMTALRSKELRGGLWDEIKGNVWEIPPHRMKQVQIATQQKPHKVLLSRQAMAILAEQKAINGDRRFIFASPSHPLKHLSENTLLGVLRRLGWHDQATIHGFRSVFSTACNEAGFDKDLIEAQLAHNDTNAIRAVYNRAEYLDRRAFMLQWWSDTLDHLKAGGEFSPDYLRQTNDLRKQSGLF